VVNSNLELAIEWFYNSLRVKNPDKKQAYEIMMWDALFSAAIYGELQS
jgi:hypothetical protein